LEKSDERDWEWKGDERREAKRRYIIDRRTMERRKKYLFSVVLPTLLGIFGAGIVSWGAYVTHATYSISAKYEETFVDYIDDQAIANKAQKNRIDNIVIDYNERISQLHNDMNDGFKDIRDALRDTQTNIYNLLLRRRPEQEESSDKSD